LNAELSESASPKGPFKIPDSKVPSSILAIKPSSLGDVVHTLPAVALLKLQWPSSQLRWLINPEWAPLLAGNPHVDEVVIFPRRDFRGIRGWMRIPGWAKKMAASKADLVLDFQGLLRSALIARLCRGGTVIGLSDAREGARFFYDRVADVGTARHAVDRYLRLVADLGIDLAQLEWALPPGNPPASWEETGPFVLLHPFSRGPGKSLAETEVAEFCRALAPVRVVVAGRADEAIEVPGNATNLLNQTSLEELIWLIRQAAFVVSVDSGPMHIAAALTPNLVAIHTWSDPAKVGPYCPEAWVWKDRALCKMRDFGGAGAGHECLDIRALAVFVAARVAGDLLG
jgi:ADP-heptose:LPS heptosyltransferase